MPKILLITCDHCGRDLTTTTNCEGYRIVLKSEGIPSAGGTVTDMAAYPDFDEPMYFCRFRCLEGWWAKRQKSLATETPQR